MWALKRKLIVVIIAVFLLIGALVIRFTEFYSMVCNDYSSNGLKGSITARINKRVFDIINTSDLDNDIYKVEYNDEKELKSVSIDSKRINELSLKLSEDIYLCIEEDVRFGFPLGNTFGLKFLSGKGPNVHVDVVPVGYVEYEIKSEVLSSGINQTLYRVKIELISNFSVLAPFYENNISIITNVIIAELLIVGNVPSLIIE